jgi:hypothetical protein
MQNAHLIPIQSAKGEKAIISVSGLAKVAIFTTNVDA